MTRGDDLRAVLDRGLHAPLPGSSNPKLRVLWRALVWAFWLTYFGFVVAVLALRYSILPHIETYRPDIERLASERLGQAISIGRIEASWEGINPDLTLLDVRVADAQGRPALAFSRIEAILSWWSVPSAKLQLRLLRIDEPTLNVRRDVTGKFFIAGLPLNETQSNNDLSDWVLAQRRIRISGATLVWEDELRHAQALVLEDVNFALDNDGSSHRFGLTALPPDGLAAKLDVRGDFRGTDLDQMALWSGTAYAEIGYADLAVWRQWVDYPVSVSRGRGALRAWIGFANGGLHEITADVALRDVDLRLAEDLPMLDLAQVSGRISGRFPASGFTVTGRRVELATQGGDPDGEHGPIRIEPTDFQIDWLPAANNRPGAGKASANRLDLGALARLAEHMPFDAHSRQLLRDYAPRGVVNNLRAKWTGDAERLQSYALQAGFDQLALKAQGVFPGFSGLSGLFEADEKAGSVSLHAGKSSVDLPAVFPVSLIELNALNVQAKWTQDKDGLSVNLSHLDFSGPEATGTAQGTYRLDHSGDGTDGGPGTINLTAALTHGDARAVWRYMPHVVGQGARDWLKSSLVSGTSPEAKLTLKGNLADFPFLDKRKGQFLVTVKARDVVLDYGKGWPRIDGIGGDLRFEGNGMIVDAHQGSILGAKLTKTRAEIPDFDAPVSTLTVKGQADGPTAEFLKFIEQSPVGEQIDHFTQDMRATGTGHLDLGLKIPLDEAKLGDSKVEGTYRLANNEVTVDAALPPIRQVNGSVQFTGSDLRIPAISGVLFGGPLKIAGGLQKDGRVLIAANGSANIAQLRKQVDSPLLDYLSGATSYRGEIRVNKRNADLVVDSNLVGLASTLPEPLSKSMNDALPLHFEKTLLAANGKEADPVTRDQIAATLGKSLAMQLIRRKEADGFALERGVIALGRPLQMPDRGLALELSASRIDLDVWRRLGQRFDSGKTSSASAAPGLLPDSISIRTPDLLVFGRHYNDVDVTAAATPAQWKMRVSSRQASGDLQWDKEGAGKLTARLKQLALEPSAAGTEAAASEATRELPALDVVADDFSLGDKRFGRLEVQARNETGVWHLNTIQATNPAGKLTASGQWQIGGGKNRTQLDFKLESSDVGKLLERMGYPGTVRAGTALMGGKIGWNSSPDDLDFSTLSGDLSLDASKGQFVKLNPGAAGRLLGLISLQGIPRRLSLDFNDVFSEGFAFDNISSKLAVQNGVMRTDRLQIDGPSARVLMRGEVDLKRETQRLSVNVQPELGGTAALGMAIVNPVAGAATWVASKLLRNPLGQILSFNYLVTGNWDDPKVEKISANTAPATAPGKPDASGSPVSSSTPDTTGGRNEAAK